MSVTSEKKKALFMALDMNFVAMLSPLSFIFILSKIGTKNISLGVAADFENKTCKEFPARFIS